MQHVVLRIEKSPNRFLTNLHRVQKRVPPYFCLYLCQMFTYLWRTDGRTDRQTGRRTDARWRQVPRCKYRASVELCG